jgi:hypothetical protein
MLLSSNVEMAFRLTGYRGVWEGLSFPPIHLYNYYIMRYARFTATKRR